jgi:hypothetical protein
VPISINGGFCHATVIDLRARPASCTSRAFNLRWDRDTATRTRPRTSSPAISPRFARQVGRSTPRPGPAPRIKHVGQRVPGAARSGHEAAGSGTRNG